MTSELTTVARGDGSGIVTARRIVVRDVAEWRALWAAHAGPDSPAPAIDFASHMVAAVFAGERSTPGHAIEIVDAHLAGPILRVVVEERLPGRGAVSAQIIVTPFHIVTLPRYDGEVRFWERHDQLAVASGAASGEPPISLAARPVPSSTGLEPNFAAALAYLAGPFSGVLLLIVERANQYVRFHAWQSVLGLGGLALLASATLVLSFLTLLLSPLAFTVMYTAAEVLAVLWVVAWVLCLVKAFTGSAWKMPFAGRYAASLK
jgi:uncharacterized membrane protein